MKPFKMLILLLTIPLILGCARSPQRHFYTLREPAQPSRQRIAPGSGPLSVVIGPVTVPDGVDRNQIVTRSSANQLDISDLHRWAEPLSSEVPAVLAANLSRDLGRAALVSVQGQETAAADADFRVAVDIIRFESTLGDSATVEAAWIIRDKHSSQTQRGQSLAREPAGDQSYDALVAAYTHALKRISRDMATAIRSESPR